MAEVGYCQCGCGRETKLAPQTSTLRGWTRGEPMPYVQGHSSRVGPWEHNWKWNGGRKTGKGGYRLIRAVDHPAADGDGYVPEHRLTVEERIGRALVTSERVHHVNGVRTDNRPENLWVFPDDSSHAVWHAMLKNEGELAVSMAPVGV